MSDLLDTCDARNQVGFRVAPFAALAFLASLAAGCGEANRDGAGDTSTSGGASSGGAGNAGTSTGGTAGVGAMPGEGGSRAVQAKLEGVAQKGPFARGTGIVISELDDELSQTGRTFTAEITDSSGKFQATVSSQTGAHVKLTASGFYYNEVTGEVSSAPLHLTALADLADVATVNVNVLTHLETPRVEYLVEQGASFADAKAQAQAEVLAVFGIAGTDIATSESLDVVGGSVGDAALLAVSTLVQGYLSVGELSELLSIVSYDLREDGTLDDASAGSLLVNAATLVDPDLVRQHLVDRYFALGLDAEIGDFETHIAHFRDVAPYPFISRTGFPEVGLFGPNALESSTVLVSGATYSLSALTPPGQPLRLRMTWTGTPGATARQMWGASIDSVNVSISTFDVENGVQDFSVVEPGSQGDVHLLLFGTAGSARIEVYEGDAEALTSTRDVSWADPAAGGAAGQSGM
jgi:hypothetical protein